MPRFADRLQEFLKGRNGVDGYFSMMTVRIWLQNMSQISIERFLNPFDQSGSRHPLGRLYSAWKDKFRNNHVWFKYIKKAYGEFLYKLERKNMTESDHEVNFIINSLLRA